MKSKPLVFVLFNVLIIETIKCQNTETLFVNITPSQSIKTEEGKPLKIMCQVNGVNAKNAVLFRNKDRVSGDNGLVVALNLDYAKPSDSGYYHCYGYSNDKVTLDLKTIKVEINPIKLANPITQKLEKYVGESILLSCLELLEASNNVEWKKSNGLLSSKSYRPVKGQLRIDHAAVSDAGDYICYSNRQEKRFKVSVTTKGMPKIPTTACPPDAATCRNGQCIPKSTLCDGKFDCTDGSDETACGAIEWLSRDLTNCDPTERLCQDNVCKQKLWFCDGEYDCADRSDELNCPSKKQGDVCNSWEFLCKSGNQCIQKGFLCDDQTDCLDGSDEIGCAKPRIVVGPQRTIEKHAGETIVITCETSGFPAPFVNWRLNWGHICQEPRCIATSDNGYGVLTIYNSVPSDSGAYSCEAINNLGRIFAVDAIVHVKPACNCHNHSHVCNDDLECINCQHNTHGTNCQYCLPGFRGDATRGTSQDCIRVISQLNCNPDGIVPGSSVRGSVCRCKPGYTGQLCDKCDTSAYLDRFGRCIPCFCNGLLDATCKPSTLFYAAEKSNFNSMYHGWSVVNRYTNYTSTYVSTNVKTGVFEFYGFEREAYKDAWFFDAPLNFKGNRLLSYGGNISFVIYYEGEPEDKPMDLEIRLSGVKIGLQYIHKEKIYPYEEQEIILPIFEKNFRRYRDATGVTKEHMLMALSNIDRILISASFVKKQYTASLRAFSFDLAKLCADDMNQVPRNAYDVEFCDCPMGYNGTSCETCSPGYDKSANEGQYLGLCYIDCKIACNGHSNDCNKDGDCYNCQHNTSGAHCDVCASGYVGDATIGEENDCSPI